MTDPKRDSNTPPAWQTPLKDLHLARVMFRDLRAQIITWQLKEYDHFILKNIGYLDHIAGTQNTGLPFPKDFSGEPHAIKQIKNFTNALYLAEQAFEKFGNLNLTTARSYDPKLITEAYEACHLLLNLSADIESNFRHEISYFASELASLLKIANKRNSPKTSFNSHDVGLTVGRAIEHRKPTSDQDGYDLLTYFGAVFPAYPSYIETLRTTIEKQTSKNPEHALNVNEQKMKLLVAQGKKLSRTIASSNQNSLYFVFNLLSLIRQMQTLFTEVYQEAGELNETLQSLGREYLALLKYELLPVLFRGVDKLEMQLMLKPGRLSKPLMEKIKPWHEALIQTAKLLIKFDETNEHLLKLEDARFIELRLKPIQEKIEASEEALHLIDPALTALDACLENPRSNTQATLKKHIEALIPYMLNTDKALLSRLYKHLHEQASKKDYLKDWYNYITFNSEETRNNPSSPNIEHALNQLKQRWKQLKTDRTFTRDRCNAHAKSIQEKAHRVLFPCTLNTNIFQVSEKETLENTYLASDETRYQTQGDTGDTYVQNPKKLNANASWVLYRSYEQKLTQLKQAQTDCDHLLKAVDDHTPWKNTKALSFNPQYNPALLDSDVLHQPENIYFKIEDAVLKYEVLEPTTNTLCSIHLMTLEDAIHAGRCGYIWNTDQKQLSYIAEDGQVHAKLALINYVLFEAYLKAKQFKHKETDDIQLNKQFMHSLSGHHPGIVRKGSIPLAELNCSLTELTAPEQLTAYLPHIFNEALERGHIHDAFKANCIRWYSSIQPYLISAFKHDKIMKVVSFDERTARLFSGSFTRNASKATPHVSLTETNNQLLALKLKLRKQVKELTKKRDTHAEQFKNKTFNLPAEPDNTLKHHEFSFDTAQFMPSVDPIKRQIHNAKKTCFKINLALTHLETYEPDARLRADDYPWFQQTYVGELSQATALQIKIQLKQMQAYETLQIKHNEQLLTQLKATSSVQTNETLDENDAFMYFGHTYEPVVMQEESQKKPGELQLEIENDQLHYKLMHYGYELEGEIPLIQIKPSLTAFDKNTVLTSDTLASILGIAYIQRKHKIDVNPDLLSPDEALDLYQWYLAKYNQLSRLDSEHANLVNQKIALYKSHAEKKPAFIEEYLENNTPEDRSDYYLKHKRISNYLNELRRDVYKHFGNLNKSLIKELNPEFNALKLPYPEVGAQNWLTHLLQELLKQKTIGVVQALLLPMLNKQLEPDNLSALENPQQVLLLKRLVNVIYYLEQVTLEIEQINEKDGQIPYVMHLVISYLYVQDIMPLLSEIAQDPVFSATHTDIVRKINAISSMLNHESKYYLETSNPEDKEKNKQATLHSVLNALKMLPERLSSSSVNFERKHPKLKEATKKSALKIESILEHYNSSWSYILLLLDLPSIQHVLNDMRHDFEGLLEHSNKATLNNLGKLKKEYLTKIVLEAEKLEDKLGLSPGLISHPLTKILDEFYKGLITPLTPDVNQQIKLLCDDNLIKERLKAAEARKKSAKTKLSHYKKASQTMQTLLDACDQAKREEKQGQEETYYLRWMEIDPKKLPEKAIKAFHKTFDYLYYDGNVFFINSSHKLICLPEEQSELILHAMRKTEKENKYAIDNFSIEPSDIHNPNHKAAYNKLSAVYQKTLPTLKASLNNSDIYLLSIQEAEHRKLRDCFVFDEEKSQLYHLDTKGELNPQTGCKLFLKAMPADEDKPEHLEREMNMLHPDDSDKTGQKISVKHATLVQHGEKYYLYANADNTGWKYTELNPEIIADMALDFSRAKPLDVHKKYQAMYDEIAKKTKLVYPIHLKNTFKAIRFITKKKESSEKTEKLYLSEHAIREYIASNSDFALQKHGVSVKPGCCFVSLKTIPKDFYELELPAGYGSYYAQVENKTDILYYIDTDTRSIKPLPIPADKQGTSEIKKLKDTRKNKIFDAHDFENMTALTNHTSDASVMIDINNFKPDEQSFDKLHALVKRSKAYYNGMIKTSELAEATADEQLELLNKLKYDQKEKNNGIKRTIYTDYFNNKARSLAQGKINLPGKHRKSFVNLNQIGWPEDKPLESIDELIPYLHTLANEYQEKFTEALFHERDNIVQRAVTSGGSKAIDKALADQKDAFDKERLKHYKQLDAINKAVEGFRIYLKASEVQSKRTLSCFEKADTIETKRKILNVIDDLASDSETPHPKDRVKAIQNHLKKANILDDLMRHHKYKATCLESLVQCIFNLLEAAGLYTPQVIKRMEKLAKAIEDADDVKPPKVNNAFRFFKETSKEKIKYNMLKPKSSDTKPGV